MTLSSPTHPSAGLHFAPGRVGSGLDRLRWFDRIVDRCGLPCRLIRHFLMARSGFGLVARGDEAGGDGHRGQWHETRSEELTSELQSLTRRAYAVLCIYYKK